MRFITSIVVATIVLGFGFSLACQFPNTNAAENAVAAAAEKPYAKSYRFTDLPVWSHDSKTLNPTLLIAYLKASIEADWDTSLTIAPYQGSLVVATTSANHDKIAKLIRDLRKAAITPDAE